MPRLFEGQTAAARLVPKPATSAYLQFRQPPRMVDGELLQQGELSGFRVRAKLYDYGVVSLALTRRFSGSWDDLLAVGQEVVGNQDLDAAAEQCARRRRSDSAGARHGQGDLPGRGLRRVRGEPPSKRQ